MGQQDTAAGSTRDQVLALSVRQRGWLAYWLAAAEDYGMPVCVAAGIAAIEAAEAAAGPGAVPAGR